MAYHRSVRLPGVGQYGLAVTDRVRSCCQDREPLPSEGRRLRLWVVVATEHVIQTDDPGWRAGSSQQSDWNKV